MKQKTFFYALLLVAIFALIGCGPSKEQMEQEQAALREAKLQKTIVLIDEQQPQAALELLQELEQRHPDDPAVLEPLAMLEMQLGRTDEAAAHFEQLSQIDPDEMHFLLYAAQMHHLANRPDAAIQLYSDYLEEFPEDSATWATTAKIHQSMNQHAQALQAYMNAHKANPLAASAEDCVAIGALFEIQGNASQAQAWFKKAWNQTLDTQAKAQAAVWLGTLATENKDYASATPYLDYLTNLEEDKPLEQRHVLAMNAYKSWQKDQQEIAYKKQQEQQAAKVAAEEALQVEALAIAEAERAEAQRIANLPPPPPTVASLEQQANAAMTEGQPQAAIQAYWKALAIAPFNPTLWAALSQTYFSVGAYDQAEMTALEALRYDDSLANTLILLKALQHSATDKKLLEALVEAHDKYPRSPEVTIDLAHGYARIANNPRNARILYEDFLELAPMDHPRRAEAQDALATL